MANQGPIVADLSPLVACPLLVFSTQVNAAGAVEIAFQTIEKLTQDINGLIAITRGMHIPEVAARLEHFFLIRSRVQRILVPDPGYQQLLTVVNSLSSDNQCRRNKDNIFGAENFQPVLAVAGPHGGQLPNDFPANMDDLFSPAWTGARVGNLLEFYNVQVLPNMPVHRRKLRLLRVICLGQ